MINLYSIFKPLSSYRDYQDCVMNLNSRPTNFFILDLKGHCFSRAISFGSRRGFSR
jgi:hypothetical protein